MYTSLWISFFPGKLKCASMSYVIWYIVRFGIDPVVIHCVVHLMLEAVKLVLTDFWRCTDIVAGRQNIYLNEYQTPMGKKTFQAKVTKSFPDGYTIETVIDGKPLRGVLFSNKPRPEQTPCNDSIRCMIFWILHLMDKSSKISVFINSSVHLLPFGWCYHISRITNTGSGETGNEKPNNDHNSVKEVTRPTEKNVNNFQQADVSGGKSIRNEAPVGDVTAEMKSPSPSDASAAQEVIPFRVE